MLADKCEHGTEYVGPWNIIGT